VELATLLPGQVTLRWVRWLHPQLTLELAAAVLTRRLELAPHVQALPPDGFAGAFHELHAARATRWPVLRW
jgi:hypothetical protein